MAIKNLIGRGAIPPAVNNAINNTIALSVSAALERVAAAERALDVERDLAREAAKRANIPLANLFGKAAYIKRSTGERWISETHERSHAEGKQAAYLELTRIFCKLNGVDFEAAMAQAKVSAKAVKERTKREQARLRAAGFFDAVEQGDYRRAGDIYFATEQRADPSGNAARRILAAAARRDSDPNNERPRPEGLAALIVRAGQKRRGEIS